jgi:hypothetical protein
VAWNFAALKFSASMDGELVIHVCSSLLAAFILARKLPAASQTPQARDSKPMLALELFLEESECVPFPGAFLAALKMMWRLKLETRKEKVEDTRRAEGGTESYEIG